MIDATRWCLSLRRIVKPHFVARPSLLLRRARVEFARRAPTVEPEQVTVRHALGVDITTYPGDAVGSSLVRLGFSDLCVSETLLRLTDAGEQVIDAGANVGAMTAVLAFAAGPHGHVLAFEPQIRVLASLRPNLARWALDPRLAPVELHEAALGDAPGRARFGIPQGTANLGEGRLLTPDEEGSAEVRLEVLDRPAGVLKIDIEGGEFDALTGAESLLADGAIRDVVFEDFALDTVRHSAVADLLAGHGYSLMRLNVTRRGLLCECVGSAPRVARGYEPPSYLATREPARALARLRPRGFSLLRARG